MSDTNQTKDGRFRFLVALLLSAQTKDFVTATAVNRLDAFLPGDPILSEEFNGTSMKLRGIHQLTVENVLRLKDPADLEKYIKPAGFYRKKAVYLHNIAIILQK